MRHLYIRLASLLAPVALAACAGNAASRPPTAASTGSPEQRPADAARPAVASDASVPKTPKRELTPTAKRLFDDALAVEEDQKKLKVPTDWEVLERRWRAVADAQPIPEAFFNVGVALEHRGKLDEARQAYRRALSVDPAFSPAAVNLAVLDEPKDPREALRVWTELRQRYPGDSVPRARLAALYENAGQLDEAWNLSREALLRDPAAIGAYKVMMRVALQRGRLDLAQLLAVKARKIREADPEVESFVGDVLLRQADEAGATLQWKKAIAIQDNFLPARYALLSRALAREQWEGVVEQAEAILKVSPASPRVRVALGIAYRHLGQVDKALAQYEQAERSGESLPELHLARGVALMKSKDQCEPAIPELRRYISEAGPVAAGESAAPRLLRECEQVLVAGRQAAEAAKEMKAQAERAAARQGAATAPPPRAAVANGTPPDASASAGTVDRDNPDKGSGVPTR